MNDTDWQLPESEGDEHPEDPTEEEEQDISEARSAGEDDAEARALERGRRLIRLLLEQERLELATSTSERSIAAGTGAILASGVEGEQLGDKLLDWLIDRPEVSEIYADGHELMELLSRLD